MKVAMWGVFLFVMGLFGVFLINTFGIITTTNQQDYTLIKNAAEAAMYDSIDYASYRAGFYFCSSEYKNHLNNEVEKDIPYSFNSKDDYKIILNSDYIASSGQNISDCVLLVGEYKLNKDVFAESFLRRFANNINNNKSYEVTIQEVIEYPPKVSIRIDTYNTYNYDNSTVLEFDGNAYDYRIRNQIDSILEEY